MPVRVRVPVPSRVPPVWLKLDVVAAALKVVVPPESEIAGRFTSGENVTVPALVVIVPVCVKIDVGSNVMAAPPIWKVAPEAMESVPPVLEPVPLT